MTESPETPAYAKHANAATIQALIERSFFCCRPQIRLVTPASPCGDNNPHPPGHAGCGLVTNLGTDVQTEHKDVIVDIDTSSHVRVNDLADLIGC